MEIAAQSNAEAQSNERRRHKRCGVMVPALLNQVPVTISDLSQGGIGAGSIEILFDGDLMPARGEQASLRFFDGVDEVSDSIEVEIVRVSNSRGEIGARYLNLTSEQARFIDRLLAAKS